MLNRKDRHFYESSFVCSFSCSSGHNKDDKYLNAISEENNNNDAVTAFKNKKFFQNNTDDINATK